MQEMPKYIYCVERKKRVQEKSYTTLASASGKGTKAFGNWRHLRMS